MQVYRVDDGVATDGTYHELQFDQGYLAKGYVKGKSGFYYLLKHSYMFSVVHVHRRNQIRCEKVCEFFLEDGQKPFPTFLEKIKTHKTHQHSAARDKQRSRCYRWEAVFGNERLHAGLREEWMEPADVEKLITKICNELGMKIPTIRYRATETCYAMSGCLVQFNLGLVCRKTVIHELAHIFEYQIHRKLKLKILDYEGHGENFVGIYMKLLVKYNDHKMSQLKRTADELKLKYSFDMWKQINM